MVKNGNIGLWRIDLTGGNVYHNLTIGRPCKVPVIPPREGGSEAFKDVLTTYDDFSVNYTDEFVSEDLRPLLTPSRFWTNPDFHELYVPVDSLEEAYEERKQFYDAGGERCTPTVLAQVRAFVLLDVVCRIFIVLSNN